MPLYFVSELAREHVTVVLTGEGSDELLAGYGKYPRALLTGAPGDVYERLCPARSGAPIAERRRAAAARPRWRAMRAARSSRSTRTPEAMFFDNFAADPPGRPAATLLVAALRRVGDAATRAYGAVAGVLRRAERRPARCSTACSTPT